MRKVLHHLKFKIHHLKFLHERLLNHQKINRRDNQYQKTEKNNKRKKIRFTIHIQANLL